VTAVGAGMRDPELAPFDVLIGSWSTEAKHRLLDEVVLSSQRRRANGVTT
jgi:hypothetical protein